VQQFHVAFQHRFEKLIPNVVTHPIKHKHDRFLSLNNLSIRSAGDLRHPDVVRDAVAQGRCKGESDFDFAKLFSDGGVEDPLSPYSREGRVRCEAVPPSG
jgi:hypothetical protein